MRKQVIEVLSLWSIFPTFIIGCFRSSCRTEDASVLQSQPERRLMTLTNEGRPHSFVRTNHRLLFVTRPMIGPRTRLWHTDYLTMDNMCERVCVVSLYYGASLPVSPVESIHDMKNSWHPWRFLTFGKKTSPHLFPKEFLIILLVKVVVKTWQTGSIQWKKMG